ncbi:MAG: hypothetical protein ACE5NC_01300 [Anaerolineae bacterium]
MEEDRRISEPPDDLDLLLKWGLRDLYPEVEPPSQVWENIRARFATAATRVAVRTEGKRSSLHGLARFRALLAAWSARSEETVWVPRRAAVGWMETVPPRPGEAIYDEQQTTIHLWVLANALGNHAF